VGFLGIFGGTKTERLVKKLSNAYAQTSERVRAMEILASMGTQESLFGLLRRFSFRVERDILDQDEKEQAFDLTVAAGEKAIPAIEEYVAQYDSVYWPLKALKEIAGLDAAVEVLLRVLDAADQREGRKNEQRDQLVANLRDFQHPRIKERLLNLCDDSNEDVRLKALDGLATYGEEAGLEAFANRILDAEESAAVKSVLFEQLVDMGWSLAPWRKEIEEREILPGFYRFNSSGAVIRS
jgi:HEAT repeat protein